MKKQNLHIAIVGCGFSTANVFRTHDIHELVTVVEEETKEKSLNEHLRTIEITNPYKDIQKNIYNTPLSGQESRRERRNPKLKNKSSHLLKRLEKNKFFK